MIEKFKEIKIKGVISIDLGEKGLWKANKKDLIYSIVDICEDFDRQGYKLTLRQLYYQLVSKDAIPNHDKVYKKLSSLKDETVYGGLIDWNILEDRGRKPHITYFEDSVKDALEYTAKHYRIDRQINQPCHVEVWTEKDAISSILKRVTDEFGLYLMVNKGYTSSTAIYSSYQRFSLQLNQGKSIKILYFGDHDPSGLDMIRDIYERLFFMLTKGSQLLETTINQWAYKYDEEHGEETFSDICWSYCDYNECREFCDDGESYLSPEKAFIKHHFQLIPIGLTMEQIKEHNPPPNPAKITDPRASKYIEKFGQVSWEVDALNPSLMTKIVREKIEENIDFETYKKALQQESEERNSIKKIISKL